MQHKCLSVKQTMCILKDELHSCSYAQTVNSDRFLETLFYTRSFTSLLDPDRSPDFEKRCCRVTNHASLFGNQMGESGFGGCWENITCLTEMCQIWCLVEEGCGSVLSGVVRETMVCFQLCGRPFLFQHDCSPVSKSRSIKTWLVEFGVEDLDWPSQSPDLNPIKHLWDEVEWKLRARPSCPKTVHDLTNAYWINGQKFPQKYSKILWPLKKCGSCYSCKGGQTPY